MTLPKIKKTNTGNKSKAAARILRALLCFAFWIGIWYIAAAALGKAVILPMPHDVAKRLIALAGSDFHEPVDGGAGVILENEVKTEKELVEELRKRRHTLITGNHPCV